VTRAAERIGLSQSAMSHALQRLRHTFKDPLLVKGSAGLALTTRALELYQPLQDIFLQLNQLITPLSFEPSITEAEISIATRDYEMATILPSIVNAIANEAPNLKLRIVSLRGDDMTALEKHEVDFVLSATESKSAMLYQKKLLDENYVCLLSAKYAKQKLTLNRYVAMKHCLITISGVGLGVVDQILSKQELKREIAIRIPHFLAASYIVANSNLIVTLPRRLGMLLSDNKKISIVEVPFKMPDFSIYLYWHSKNQNNPIHQWVRKKITSAESNNP
jgi:DNA-binding transcriptional LysR family regulator